MGQATEFKKQILIKDGKRWVIVTCILGVLITAGSTIYGLRQTNLDSQDPPPVVTEPPKISSVTALGRIEPKGEVIKLAPAPNMGGAKVVQLLIEEGDRVQKGQVVAILDNLKQEQTAVNLAQQELKVAQANLDIVKAGAKQGEIEAQRATIQRLQAQLDGEIATHQVTIERLQAELAGEQQEQQATIERLQAELNDAEKDFQRYQKLALDGVISESDLDQRSLNLATARERVAEAKARLKKTSDTLNQRIAEERANFQKQIDTLQKQIDEAKATLDRIAEIRPVDVQKAQAEVDKANAALKQAQADLDLAYVKAPVDGQILKIHSRPGAKVDDDKGIAEIGNTDQMMVIAEVYESDISKVKLGQKALITSENNTFTDKLTGTVTQIGLQIGKKDVLETDPAADVDVRVIEVKILLDPDSSRRVDHLTYAKVVTEIPLEN
ncbi:ABC exporter membrane fusion protein, DevB family [Gloeothece citriformis PCC 7424]|uniref:ABC exporter membrane fusion protein, DevB family n=1 Tax=Gloeothece citriformis (strain PCC 7424) TaxID=65393 RepID=B7K7Z6_GLOC7|nr:ABC exporter membrane fusion protein [Gloeothece citriformis]ACK68484.1 ABC exporter membrane fusion protein, DevB family [Gloeothece citriformis PCC 7424]